MTIYHHQGVAPYAHDNCRIHDAQSLTRALSGTWHQSYGTANCPVCQPERRQGQNALTLTNGRVGLLAHCKKSNCAFIDILTAAGIRPGAIVPPDPAKLAQREAEARMDAERAESRAMATWREAIPVKATAAERYLRGRGITCDVPKAFRFHPACRHPTAPRLPALVALVEGLPRLAIHRTYLRPDGSGKADADPPRAMLGRSKGGAVKLTEADGPLVVAEGIETALSLASGLLGRPATVWAALSASGMAGLCLPDRPHRLTIASDGDRAGRVAAYRLAERASTEGWTVSMLPAPEGLDWNDVLQSKGGAA